MTESLPSAAVERIDEVCDRFEAAWKAGQTPRMEDFLEATTGPEREMLLRELQRVDAHYRSRAQTAAASQDEPFVAGYEVLGELGRGGMGVVYKVRQLRPNRLVALKMISAGLHASPRVLERFLREADAVAQLQHANIVQVYEVGEQDGRPYFAMEYVAGGSLDQHLSGLPQPPHAAARFVMRLAQAIHHAHQHGVIHRDLKPANILMVRDESSPDTIHHAPLTTHEPKITDFGLAKLLDDGAGHPTQTGDLLGTPSYMAPEQVGSTVPISAATDVYGLGSILYELLTGRPPFCGETALETVIQVQTVEPVSPSRLQPKCPRDLVTICLKCLNKQAHERYADASTLAEDLRRFLDGQPIRARPVGQLRQVLKWAHRQPVVASLTGLLLLAVTLGVGTGSWFWWQAEDGLKKAEVALGNELAAQTDRVATLDRYQIALAHREWQANNFGHAEALLDACTPAKKQSWEWRYLDRMRHSALHSFSGHTNTVQALAIHPSGRRVASASHDKSLRLWDLDTGRGTVQSHHQALALAVAYSPDGRLLASSGSNDGLIRLWDADTGAELPGLAFGGKGEIVIWALAFDPTSRFLAAGGPRRVKVWDMRDRTLVYDRNAHPGAISQVAFSPDGRYLVTAMTTVKVWDWTDKAGQPLEWPGHASGTHDLAFSPDGSRLATGGRDALIRVYSFPTGREEFTLNGHQLSVTSVSFSPDGEHLASAGQEGDMHVWSVRQRRRLFTLHGHSGTVWDLKYAETPDGVRLVSAGHDFKVQVWNAATSQEAVALPVQCPQEISALAYSPDGRLIAWGDSRGQSGVWDTLHRKDVRRHDDPKLRATNPILSFAFSPDGRLLACRRRNGPATLWDLERAAETPLLGEGNANPLGLAFTADGRQLLAASWENEILQLHDLLTGQKRLSLPRPGRLIYQVVWSPDARIFVTNEDRRHARLWTTDTGQPLGELEYQPSLTCIAFNDNGRFLAVGGVGGGVRVWDVTANRETMSATGHSSRVYGLALSPDGRRLASAASDCTAKLWDTHTGHEVLALRTQLHEHSPLAYSPDGADLVSANMDNQLQIWSARSVVRAPESRSVE